MYIVFTFSSGPSMVFGNQPYDKVSVKVNSGPHLRTLENISLTRLKAI